MEITPVTPAKPEVLELFSLHDDFMLGFLGEDNWFYHRYSEEEHIEKVWLAKDGGAPAGCIAFRTKEPGVGEVKRLFLRPEYRGRGISKELLAALERYAAEQGCRKLYLDTRTTFEPAVSLYRAAGFEVTFKQGLYIQMEKTL